MVLKLIAGFNVISLNKRPIGKISQFSFFCPDFLLFHLFLFSVIDTCEHYCTKVRHRLTRKDGKSSTETVRRSTESSKRRRSKEPRSEDCRTTSKAGELKMPTVEKAEPKKCCPDKEEAEKSDQLILAAPECKRIKIDDKHDSSDVIDHSTVVAELAVKENGKCRGRLNC